MLPTNGESKQSALQPDAAEMLQVDIFPLVWWPPIDPIEFV
jgi:hypothetical protein